MNRPATTKIMLIILTINQFSASVACLGGGQSSCGCSGTKSGFCPCSQQATFLRNAYVPLPASSFIAPLPPPYPPRPAINPYSAVNTGSLVGGATYLQTHELPQTYDELQLSQQPILPLQPSRNVLPRDENSVSFSGGSNPSFVQQNNIYGYPRRTLTILATVAPPTFGPFLYPNESNIQRPQIQVVPAATGRELGNGITEEEEQNSPYEVAGSSDPNLPAQNVVYVSSGNSELSNGDDKLENYQSSPITTKKYVKHVSGDKALYRDFADGQNSDTRTTSDGDSKKSFENETSYSENIGESRSHPGKSLEITDYAEISESLSSSESPIYIAESTKYQPEDSRISSVRIRISDPRSSEASNSSLGSVKAFNAPTFEQHENFRSEKKLHIYSNNLHIKDINLSYGGKNVHSKKGRTNQTPRAQSLPFLESSLHMPVTGRRAAKLKQCDLGKIGNIIAFASCRSLRGSEQKLQSGVTENAIKKKSSSVGEDITNFLLESSPNISTRNTDQAKVSGINAIPEENTMIEDEGIHHYMTYHHQSCAGRMLHRSQNETVASAAQKCADLDCEAANARILPNNFLEVMFLKDIRGRFKDFGSHCISKTPVNETSFMDGFVEANGQFLTRNHFRLYDEPVRKIIHRANRFHRLRGMLQNPRIPLSTFTGSNKRVLQ